MNKNTKIQMKVAILFILTVFTLSSFAQETKSYQGIIELDGASYFQEDTPFLCRVDFINGYRFNPNVSMGLGIGLRFVPKEIGNDAAHLLPVYGNLRPISSMSNVTMSFPIFRPV